MTTEQIWYYKQAKIEIIPEIEANDWSAIWIFRLFTALQTIVCGWWNRTDPKTGTVETIKIKHNRLDLLMASIAEIPDKERIIIWTKYRLAADQIRAFLSNKFGADQVSRFDGGISEIQRNAELQRFRGGARFFVATQSSGGHGLTLNESAYSVFYADNFKYSERAQAEDRNHRIGQERPTVYVTLRYSNTIDDKIASALDRKGNALAEFQQQIEMVKKQGTKAKAFELLRTL